MISWKHSFERINEEYKIVKRKKQALDDLLSTGKISQSTYDSINQEMNDAIAEIERQQKALLEKMNSKVDELEKQVKILETLLANFEIKHVTGEVDEDVYRRETELLSMGLETARRELDVTKETVNQFLSGIEITEATAPTPTPETSIPQEIETQPAEEVTPLQPEVEVTEETVSTAEPEEAEAEGEVAEEDVEEAAEEKVEESLSEYPVESVEAGEAESFENPQETSEETLQNPEESQPTETEAEEEQEE